MLSACRVSLSILVLAVLAWRRIDAIVKMNGPNAVNMVRVCLLNMNASGIDLNIQLAVKAFTFKSVDQGDR